MTKTCTKCSETKPVTEFYKRNEKRGRLCSECKVCTRISSNTYRAANAVRVKVSQAEWYATNTEKVRAHQASYRAANPEKVMVGQASYRAANSEKIRARHAAYYAANPEKIRARARARQKTNLEACRINNQNRRALKRANGGTLSKGLAEKLFNLQKGKCPCCNKPLGDDYHLDHIMPIILGGLNVDKNIQLLRQKCNNQKYTKHPVDFMQSRGFLI